MDRRGLWSYVLARLGLLLKCESAPGATGHSYCCAPYLSIPDPITGVRLDKRGAIPAFNDERVVSSPSVRGCVAHIDAL